MYEICEKKTWKRHNNFDNTAVINVSTWDDQQTLSFNSIYLVNRVTGPTFHLAA